MKHRRLSIFSHVFSECREDGVAFPAHMHSVLCGGVLKLARHTAYTDRNTRNATEVHAITVAVVPPFARLNRRAKTWTRPHRTTCTRTGAWACQISTIDSSLYDRICFSAVAAAACAQQHAAHDAQCRGRNGPNGSSSRAGPAVSSTLVAKVVGSAAAQSKACRATYLLGHERFHYYRKSYMK